MSVISRQKHFYSIKYIRSESFSGLKSSIDACGMGIGQVHYNVRDI